MGKVVINGAFLLHLRQMSSEKDFWQMTRRERRGTIVLLAFIALLLVATATVRSCRTDEAPSVGQMYRFEKQADSVTVDMGARDSATRKQHKTSAVKRKPKSKPKPKKYKPAAEPRRVDPVPQF
jgi:hypothetical protein